MKQPGPKKSTFDKRMNYLYLFVLVPRYNFKSRNCEKLLVFGKVKEN